MADQEKEMLALETQFAEASGTVFAAACQQALALGHSVLQSEQGIIYEIFPDGKRRQIKKIEAPTPVKRGLKVVIR